MRGERERINTEGTEAESAEDAEKKSWEIVGCPGPSAARPDAPNCGAEKKSGRSGRDDREE